MKRPINGFIVILFVLFGCVPKKGLKTELPFRLGQVYAQRWIVEDNPEEIGYDVIIPIQSLDTRRASLQKLYHRGKGTDIKIKLRKIGAVAVAEYPPGILGESNTIESDKSTPDRESNLDKPLLPYQITGTQAILTYLEEGKIKYFKIADIRQNPIMSYSSLTSRNVD